MIDENISALHEVSENQQDYHDCFDLHTLLLQTFKKHGEEHETGNMAEMYGAWNTPQVVILYRHQ